jgi:hypothetical protein
MKHTIARLLSVLIILTIFFSVLSPPAPVLAAQVIDPGDGEDGDITITAGTTYNINVQNNSGRSCIDGGDAVAYAANGWASDSMSLAQSPNNGCLNQGDEVLILSLQSGGGNTGNFEYKRIDRVTGNTVYFTETLSRSYGGRVMLQRVPNYDNVELYGTVTSNGWNGSLYGVVAFRVKGTLSGSGQVDVSGKGFRGGGNYGSNNGEGTGDAQTYGLEGHGNMLFGDCPDTCYWATGAGSGAGHATAGGNTTFRGGGTTYGVASLSKVYLGSGGGRNGDQGTKGGNGGGIALVSAHSISGIKVYANGSGGGGGGAGGSARVESISVNMGGINANNSSNGGNGRVAVYYGSILNLPSSPTAYTEQANLPPTGGNVTFSGDEETAIMFDQATFSAPYNDVDGDPFSGIVVVSLPANGVLQNSTTAITAGDEIPAGELGNVNYTPIDNFFGNDTFSFKVSDGYMPSTDAYTATITVNNTQDKPTTINITTNINEDVTLAFTASIFNAGFNDVDNETAQEIKISSLPLYGSLTMGASPITVDQTIPIANIGQLLYTPPQDWFGSTTFDWNASDGTDYADAGATQTINVAAVNDAPVPQAVDVTTDKNTVYAFQASDFSGSITDVEGDSLAEIQIYSIPDASEGELRINNVAVSAGVTLDVGSISSLRFAPASEYQGISRFAWKVNDGTDWSASTADVSVNVGIVPTATPTATPTPTPTPTPTSTNTPTLTSTATFTPTATVTPYNTGGGDSGNNDGGNGNNGPTATVTPYFYGGSGSGTGSDLNMQATLDAMALTQQAAMLTQQAEAFRLTEQAGGVTMIFRAKVYVDGNEDKAMTLGEGATGVEVVIIDENGQVVAAGMTENGTAVIELPALVPDTYMVAELPYLERSQSFMVEKGIPDLTLEFPLKRPDTPNVLP